MGSFLDQEDSYKYCLFSLGYDIFTTQGFRKEDVLLEHKGDVVTTEVVARHRKYMRKKKKDALYMMFGIREVLYGKHDMCLINYNENSLKPTFSVVDQPVFKYRY